MHEVYDGVRKQAAHECNLSQRGTVEMSNATLPHRTQHGGIRIALNGVKNIAWETRNEFGGRLYDRIGT